MSRNEVKDLLGQAKVTPKKSLGQNFCCDPQLIVALARDADPQPDELVLEIGTGTGALTRELSKRVKRLISVEIDSGLYKLVSEIFKDDDTVRLIHGDVLKTKNKLNSKVTDAIDEEMQKEGIGGLRVIANLPYAITTPVVIQLLEYGAKIRGMTILIQKEAAERFVARSGTKSYGSVSVLLAQWMRGRILRSVPSEVFFPRPKVQSAVLSLEALEPEERPSPELYATLRPMVRVLFNSRRKTLNKASKIAAKCDPSLAKLHEAISACELDASVRVEDLEPDEFRVLAAELIKLRDES